MRLGERQVQRGMQGPDIEELQVRLAGFRGTVPDADFGPGTELQVACFQRDYMGQASPNGVCDAGTLRALDEFARRYPIDFAVLRCPCGACDGFGQGRFRGVYREPEQRLELFHRFEYPGIHRMLLWAVRALFFYAPEDRFVITSGYRCGVRNEQKGRTSTNHHGKAIDLDVEARPGEDRRDDMQRCDGLRGLLVERSNAQIGWAAMNRKALEPSNIAPTWVHYDVRCYEPRYLDDRFFCTDEQGLNDPVPVTSDLPVPSPVS